MSKSFKGILINPRERTITEVVVEEPTLQSLYKLTGCDCVTIAHLDDGHTAWVDDEGLFKPNGIFKIQSYHSPLAGNAVILSNTSQGEHSDCKLTVAEVIKTTQFLGEI